MRSLGSSGTGPVPGFFQDVVLTVRTRRHGPERVKLSGVEEWEWWEKVDLTLNGSLLLSHTNRLKGRNLTGTIPLKNNGQRSVTGPVDPSRQKDSRLRPPYTKGGKPRDPFVSKRPEKLRTDTEDGGICSSTRSVGVKSDSDVPTKELSFFLVGRGNVFGPRVRVTLLVNLSRKGKKKTLTRYRPTFNVENRRRDCRPSLRHSCHLFPVENRLQRWDHRLGLLFKPSFFKRPQS